MPHDINGQELKVGDLVLIPCRVTEVHMTEEYCNVNLQARYNMPLNDSISTFVLNTKQVIKEN